MGDVSLKTLVAVSAFLILVACGHNIVVEGTIPTPRIAALPVNVGIHYSEEFRSFEHKEEIEDIGSWKISLGEQNYVFFRTLMETMFETTQEVLEPPLSPTQLVGLDGVVVPEIEKYGFLTPGISGLNFYSASIHYRVTLFNIEGEKVHEWQVVGYGKSETGLFNGDTALKEATVMAIRDGGARIAIDIPQAPSVLSWVAEVNGGAS